MDPNPDPHDPNKKIADDHYQGVFNYLDKMLMEEDDLANRPCMSTDSLALQATETSFYNVLVEKHSSGSGSGSGSQETELLKLFDTTLLCEDITHLWLHNLGSSSFRGNVKKKRRKVVGQVVNVTKLLIQCSEKVAFNDAPGAVEILKMIRKYSSPNGSSTERKAHYFANAIEARICGKGLEVYQAFSSVSADQMLKSYKAYITACPFHRMSNIYANKSIMKLVEGRDKVHIIDFGILYGFQWPCIIHALSLRSGGPPQLRITGIDFPQPGPQPTERVEETGHRLAEYAKRFNVPFQYKAIAKDWENVLVEDLEINPEEILVVNCLYRMRNVPDETLVESGPRNLVLKFIRELNPQMFVHGVLNGTFNSTYFPLFDMFEATYGREDKDREFFEQHVLGRDIVNVVACEGRSRVERPETYQKLQLKNSRNGFVQMPLDSDLVVEARAKVEKNYHKDFMVHQDNNWMWQGWKGKILYALSLWRPAN
ncbi:scarecrow-like protein 30 [Artemisia annua]|uniref:Scarecrow-like protein 30 n=1 Tax=Artemisia annua TaxID=35608 RepID=A0A2U1MZK6_ARTAN|nr:scarecrow-like protein 30 [Artemisia annua]